MRFEALESPESGPGFRAIPRRGERDPMYCYVPLDARGTLHHVILRGMERGTIVTDAKDRAAFVARLAAVARTTETYVYAWALLLNHAHVLLHSVRAGSPRCVPIAQPTS